MANNAYLFLKIDGSDVDTQADQVTEDRFEFGFRSASRETEQNREHTLRANAEEEVGLLLPAVQAAREDDRNEDRGDDGSFSGDYNGDGDVSFGDFLF